MTAKHLDPVYRRNAATIRRKVARGLLPRVCWRCGQDIEPEETFDVGHRDPAGPPELWNLSPEHRYRRPGCQGNRAAGGRLGAAARAAAPRRVTSTRRTAGPAGGGRWSW